MPDTSQAPATVIMGVDPGLASTGVAVLAQSGGRIHARHAMVLRTRRATKKALRELRITADDKRRLVELADGIESIGDDHSPQAVAVETYAPRPGRAGAGGWKSSMVYGLVCGIALTHGWGLFPFRAGDLKRRLAGNASATKDEVAQIVCDRVEGLRTALLKIPKSQREHVTDAAGHALLALAEIEQMRQLIGWNDPHS